MIILRAKASVLLQDADKASTKHALQQIAAAAALNPSALDTAVETLPAGPKLARRTVSQAAATDQCSNVNAADMLLATDTT